MGLNKLFRRFTLSNGNYSIKPCKLLSSKQNDCMFVVEKTNNDNHQNLYNKKKLSFSTSKNTKKSVTSTYPSCPALNVSSNNKNGTQNNDVIPSCCVSSSSSSSLIIHQHQTSKNLKYFLRSKRSATTIRQNQIANGKKRSWILSRGHSSVPNTFDFVSESALSQLPKNLFLKCIDQINDPFELCRLKSLNSSVFQHIQQRLERIIEIDIRKIKFDTISLELAKLTQSSHTTSKTFLIDHKTWYVHKHGCKVLMRFADNGRRIEIIVDDSWTSKDVFLLHNIMEVFRKTLQRIILDAPIFELAIASLSIIDLDRWYAFQCFMKAVNDFQIHLAITKIPQNTRKDDFYWPKAEALIIRTTERDSTHLSRILDYGVRSQLVMDRCKLNVLKIVLTDVKKMNRLLTRNLYHFRCWAGSAGFDDRFSQQYCVNVA